VRESLEVAVPSGPIRVAIVGTGGIARVHAEALRPDPAPGPPDPAPGAPEAASGAPDAACAALVAAADVDPDRLAAFAREHGVSATYSRLDDLLRDARPDLVHICTPPFAHHQQALTCLQAGVSVLVEKPPVISLPRRGRRPPARAHGSPASTSTGSGRRFGG
jgi:predicted dehydrogenase